jgi:negative regulator of flagellin synthesis FlgM
MSIDKIGQITNLNGYNKINKVDSTKNIDSTDKINISNEALSKAESNKILEIVKSAPDVRADKIAEIKEKLKDPNYLNDAIIGKTADSIISSFKI